MGLNSFEEDQARKMSENNVKSLEECRNQIKTFKMVGEMGKSSKNYEDSSASSAPRPDWIENAGSKGAMLFSILGLLYGFYDIGLDIKVIFYAIGGMIIGYYIVETIIVLLVGSIAYGLYIVKTWFF